MGKNIIVRMIILGLIFTLGCARQTPQDTAIRINQFTMSLAEFQQALKDSGYSVNKQDKEKFLEDLINRKLILQEAEQQGLDKQQEFLREIEHFWEKTLLKNIVDQKSKAFSTSGSVNETEIRSRYDEMVNKGLTGDSYEQAYDQIKWQLLRDKQQTAFTAWLEGLRKQARIEVDKELLGIR